jgi:RNA polymerase sigma factor (sigma-70 family)
MGALSALLARTALIQIIFFRRRTSSMGTSLYRSRRTGGSGSATSLMKATNGRTTHMAPDNHQALILRAQLGDSNALNHLLLVTASDARRYARRQCQTSDIDDAVQEALLIVARKITALKAAAAFSGWLFTIVKRECDRLARSMFAHESLEEQRIEKYLAAKTDLELRVELAAAFESLPAHYRRVILMRDFEELTISEISAALEESPSTVKSRLHRARAMVREYLLGDAPGNASQIAQNGSRPA